ncbi:hypothetical protein ACGFYT_15310 [Streptomyces sp. NPDC048208]|uniref:hypothetical protein n=1 Tax=unclassified Streptomyces TaxID=2593676 RepID=UPI0033F30085
MAADTSSPDDERALFQDTVAEYLWARDVAGLLPRTLESLVKPVLQICSFYDTVPWRLTPRDVDRYFAGPGKARKHSTTRSKITRIDGFFAFLEQRYRRDPAELRSRSRVAHRRLQPTEPAGICVSAAGDALITSSISTSSPPSWRQHGFASGTVVGPEPPTPTC